MRRASVDVDIGAALAGTFALFGIVLATSALLFGAAASWLASTKGRSEAWWFILGMVLGPLAWILAWERSRAPAIWGPC